MTVARAWARDGRGKIVCEPWHYVSILQRKPGALRNGAPFKDWKLPDALGRLRTRLAARDDGDRQFVTVLAAVLEDGMEAVEAACAEALDCGACSADIVRSARVAARRAQRPRPAAPAGGAGHHPDARGSAASTSAGSRLSALRQPEGGRSWSAMTSSR